VTSKFTELAIDGADPVGLAWFWCSALSYRLRQDLGGRHGSDAGAA
jgi:hypothetical protein